MLVPPFHEASKFLHNCELKHLLYSQFSTLLGMSFQNTSPEHYCNQGATSRPQHPDDLVSTTLGCAPPFAAPSTSLHMPPITWAHVPPPQKMGQEQGGYAVSAPLP